jgi:hypothetical protein
MQIGLSSLMPLSRMRSAFSTRSLDCIADARGTNLSCGRLAALRSSPSTLCGKLQFLRNE